ncbi:MAG TPA: HD domain-containing protein [Acidimicrobiales bacterium]|nr:HD domain-containing protein [Acidimicrobiales bacterium]
MSAVREAYGDRYVEALGCAARWHLGDHRKGSDVPYLSHLLEVSALVWEFGGDETQAVVGLLHDVLEDTTTAASEIADRFGVEVVEMVVALSDHIGGRGAGKQAWKPRKEEYLRKLADHDRRVALVAAADKIANLRSIVTELDMGEAAGWERFTAGMGGTAWYYEQVAQLLAGGPLAGSRPARMLVDLWARMSAHIGRERGAMAELDAGLARCLLKADPLGLGAVDGATTYPWFALELVRCQLGRNGVEGPAGPTGAGVRISPAVAAEVWENWFGTHRRAGSTDSPAPPEVVALVACLETLDTLDTQSSS